MTDQTWSETLGWYCLTHSTYLGTKELATTHINANKPCDIIRSYHCA